MARAPGDPVPAVLEYGEVVTFGKLGTAARFHVQGLDMADGDRHAWTQRQTAELEFGLRLPSEPVELRLDAMPFLAPAIAAQQLFVFLNGLFLGFATLPESRMVIFGVERTMISSRQNRLSLVVPTAVSPSALGLGDDQRQLGIALISLSFALRKP